MMAARLFVQRWLKTSADIRHNVEILVGGGVNLLKIISF